MQCRMGMEIPCYRCSSRDCDIFQVDSKCKAPQIPNPDKERVGGSVVSTAAVLLSSSRPRISPSGVAVRLDDGAC
jgi:hypothetical protein